MSVNTYALTDTNTLSSYVGGDTSALTIYHDQSVSATAATVGISGSVLTLIITGGANAGTSTFTLSNSSYDTLSELVTGINALAKGWVAALASGANGSSSSTNLEQLTTVSAYGSAATVTIRINDLARMELVIDAASGLLEGYWGRKMLSRSYTEWYDGDNTQTIFTRQYPITAITRVCVGRVNGIEISFTGTGTHAYVSVSSGTVTLTSIASGTTTTTATLATGTLDALATTINSTTGWTATVMSGYGLYSRTNLADTFNLWAKTPTKARLEVADTPSAEYRTDDKAGIIYLGDVFTRDFDGFGGAVQGRKNIFVEYTAGYSSGSLQYQQIKELATRLAAYLYSLSRSDAGMQSETLGDYSYTRKGFEAFLAENFVECDQYRRRDVFPI